MRRSPLARSAARRATFRGRASFEKRVGRVREFLPHDEAPSHAPPNLGAPVFSGPRESGEVGSRVLSSLPSGKGAGIGKFSPSRKPTIHHSGGCSNPDARSMRRRFQDANLLTAQTRHGVPGWYKPSPLGRRTPKSALHSAPFRPHPYFSSSFSTSAACWSVEASRSFQTNLPSLKRKAWRWA